MDFKRKIVGASLGKGPAKLRKISLNVFDTSEPSTDSSSVVDNHLVSSTQSNPASSVGTDLVDHALEEIVLKTALWIFNNSDKAGTLIEKSKENPMLAFLCDPHGKTPAGRMYLKEMQRLNTEKEVQSVCSGIQSSPVVHTGQIASFIEQSRAQALAASVNFGNNVTVGISEPLLSTSCSVVPKERRNRWGPNVNEVAQSSVVSSTTAFTAAPSHHSASSSSSSSGSSRLRDASQQQSQHITTEAAHVARMAATFDQSGQQDTARMERLLQEQREMQLLESRIRDAASHGLASRNTSDAQSITEVAKFLAEHADKAHVPGNNNHNSKEGDAYAVNLSARKGPALLIAEKQAALYLERLAQYQELAALDDDKYRDTVEECERNGGVIEGGTWEHRKRAKEMLHTATKSLELTLLGAGKHHMADYLPPDVLQAFLKNAEHVSKGTEAVVSTGDQDGLNKIDASNVGFQLLKKSGWAEGSGLGARGTGIVQPLLPGAGASAIAGASANFNSGGAGYTHAVGSAQAPAPVVVNGVSIAGGRGPDGAGLGAAATHEVTSEDTEFDQYRKRMMLAYRFRPNPLNNPRRNYY